MVVCIRRKTKSSWRSRKSINVGLEPKWTQELVTIEYKEPTNILNIEVRDALNLDMIYCQGEAEAKIILDSGDAEVNIPVSRNGKVVGTVKFETFAKKSTTNVNEDSKHPHVKVGCAVCKDTHSGPSGSRFSCPYCVCVKCKGTGKRIKDGQTCEILKT